MDQEPKLEQKLLGLDPSFFPLFFLSSLLIAICFKMAKKAISAGNSGTHVTGLRRTSPLSFSFLFPSLPLLRLCKRKTRGVNTRRARGLFCFFFLSFFSFFFNRKSKAHERMPCVPILSFFLFKGACAKEKRRGNGAAHCPFSLSPPPPFFFHRPAEKKGRRSMPPLFFSFLFPLSFFLIQPGNAITSRPTDKLPGPKLRGARVPPLPSPPSFFFSFFFSPLNPPRDAQIVRTWKREDRKSILEDWPRTAFVLPPFSFFLSFFFFFFSFSFPHGGLGMRKNRWRCENRVSRERNDLKRRPAYAYAVFPPFLFLFFSG